MLQQLFWAEVLLKGSAAFVLILAPVKVAAVLGLPSAGNGFWPRLVGALLLGITAVILLQGSMPIAKMLTPAGLLVINLATAAMLLSVLVLGTGPNTRRGTALLWVMTAGLALLSLVEISFI